ARRVVEVPRVIGRRDRVVLDADHHQSVDATGDIDRSVLENAVRGSEWHGGRDATVDVGLHRARTTLGRLDHDPLARMHGDSGAGRRSLTPIGLDRREEGDPLVLWSHAMQPVAAVRDGYLADRRADLRLRRSGKDRVAAP